MKKQIKFRAGKAANNYSDVSYWFNFLPYCFIAKYENGFFKIQAGWLMWEIAIGFFKQEA